MRCHIYLDRRRSSVESVGYRVLRSGTEVEVWRKTVHVPTNPFGPDCPKIIAVGSVFVVHWLEGDVEAGGTPSLHKAWLDVAAYDTTPSWTYEGSINITRFMHDLRPLEGSDTDYVVAYTSTGNVPRVLRQNGMTWLDVAWNVPLIHAVALRVLAIWGEDGGAVVVAYERTGGSANQVWCTRLTASSGAGAAHSQVFSTLPAVYLFQAGFAEYSSTHLALVVEVTETAAVSGSPLAAGLAIPSLAWGFVAKSTAAMGNHHSWHHLRMLSLPWAFAAAREDGQQPNIYAIVGYKNAGAGSEFIQRNVFVVHLDAQRWGNSSGTVRARPCSNLTLGDFDCRVSGNSPDGGLVPSFSIGRRVNHVSAVSPGAAEGLTLKTRTASLLAFARLMAISSSGQPPLQPVHATTKAVRYHIEEPWVVRRDESEPGALAAPYHGLSPFPVGQVVEAGAGGLVGGGTPAYFDGRRLLENGYCWYPESFTATRLGEGELEQGTRLYVATYEHRDDKGQLHRSAPSLPLEYDVADPGGDAVALSASTLTLTMRDNTDRFPGVAPVEIVWWRTTAGGTVFHRLFAQYGATNRPQDTPTNDPTTWQVTATDNVSDADLIQQEILPYSLINGAWTPLPPYQPPAFTCICSHQNRIFGASSQDGQIWYSQEQLIEPGGTAYLPPEWNPSLVHRIDGLGRVMAMVSMDEALVVLLEDGVAAVTGFGAAPDGTGSSLQTRLVTTGLGCIEPRSVVLTPEGVFFQSFKGLYLLNRGYGLDYIAKGAQVEDSVLAGGNVRAATHFEDRHEVRFVTNDAVAGAPSVLTYDYLHDLWSHASLALGDQPGGADALSAAAGGCAWLGTSREALHAVLEQGALLLERSADDASPYTDEDRDSTDAIPLQVRTGWVHPSGLAGYQRTREIGISLAKPDASGVRVVVATDFDGSYDGTLTETFDFASPAPAYLRCRLRYQKGQAYRVQITELAPLPSTENLQITGMTLEVGRKRGLRKG
ncbi:MAG: hypothetical protein KC501_40985 [Myxococcales bacterium]|nr:hypothetical protein [Myxococcales bacterium]